MANVFVWNRSKLGGMRLTLCEMRAPDALIATVGGAPEGMRLSLEAMSLADLVSWEYDVEATQVMGGPRRRRRMVRGLRLLIFGG